LEWEKAGVERQKIDKFVFKAIGKMAEDSLKDFKEKEKQKRDEIQATLDQIKSVEEKQQANRKEREKLLFGFDNSSPVMSMDEAFDPSRQTKWDKAKELDKQNAELEKEKTKYSSELAKQKAEELKLQTDFNAAQTALNIVLKETESANIAIKNSSPWENEVKGINSAISALKEYNSLKGGGGSSSPSSTASPLSTPALTQAVSNGTNTTTGSITESFGFGAGVYPTTPTYNTSANNTVNNSSNSNSSINIQNLNIDGRGSAASSSVAQGTQQILSDSGVAKYLTRRG
jgi:hypothetical protein